MIRAVAVLALAAPVMVTTAAAQSLPEPWRAQMQAGYLHQFESNIDNGGDLAVDRAFVQAGIDYAFDPRTSAGFTIGYRFDSFDFGGNQGFAALRPWSDVQELRLSTPVRFGIGDNVDAFVVPQVAWSAETGAGFGDAFTGGAIAAAAYRINPDLRLGLGVGVFSQIEDDAQFFPVLVIDWKVTDSFSISTNPSVGLTRGPTINANWQAVDDVTLTLGFGYESYRFRTDTDDRVGQEKGFPIYASATWRPIPQVSAAIFGGAQVAGEVRLEDKNGNRIAKEDYDPAAFLGIAAQVRF